MGIDDAIVGDIGGGDIVGDMEEDIGGRDIDGDIGVVDMYGEKLLFMCMIMLF